MRTIEIKITKELWQTAYLNVRKSIVPSCKICVVAAALSKAAPDLEWTVGQTFAHGYKRHSSTPPHYSIRLPSSLNMIIHWFDTSPLGGLGWFDFHYPNGASFVLLLEEYKGE